MIAANNGTKLRGFIRWCRRWSFMRWASVGLAVMIIAAATAGYYVGRIAPTSLVTTTITKTVSILTQLESARLYLGTDCSRCQVYVPFSAFTLDGIAANDSIGSHGVVLPSGTVHTITALPNYTGACNVVEPPCSSSGQRVTVYFIKWTSCEWYEVPGNWSEGCNVIPHIEDPYMTSYTITLPVPAPGGSIIMAYGALYSPYNGG